MIHKEEIVEGKGQFSIRGGILDFYPQVAENAYRIEFFGDEIDSIREFDVITQRSLEKVKNAVISPSNEIILTDDDRSNLIRLLSSEDVFDELKKHLNRDIEKLNTRSTFHSIYKYIPTIYPNIPTIVDYLDGHIIFFCEPKRISSSAESSKHELDEMIKTALEKQILIAQGKFDTII